MSDVNDMNPSLEFKSERIEFQRCPACSSTIRELYDVSGYKIFQCRTCLHGFVNPTPTENAITTFYRTLGGHATSEGSSPNVGQETFASVQEREAKYPNSTIDAARIVENMRFVDEGHLLDIGCGYGFFSRAASDRGFEVTALEIAAEEASVARAMNPDVAVVDSTFEDFSSTTRFDAIIMSQVLEHARQPEKWLKKARSICRRGAVIAIAVPNFRAFSAVLLKSRDPYLIPPAHLSYFTERSLALLLNQSGWKILKSETITRLPTSAFTRRFGNVLGLYIHRLAVPMLPIVDKVGAGTMINVYASAE